MDLPVPAAPLRRMMTPQRSSSTADASCTSDMNSRHADCDASTRRLANSGLHSFCIGVMLHAEMQCIHALQCKHK